jgi:hypothetical protein
LNRRGAALSNKISLEELPRPRLNRRSHHFFCGVVHPFSGDDSDARLSQYAPAFFDVGALKPCHDRNRNAKVLCRRDHTIRYHIAADNAAKDIDQDRLYVLVGKQDLERLLNTLLRGSAPDIQEVCRLAARQLTMQPILPSSLM